MLIFLPLCFLICLSSSLLPSPCMCKMSVGLYSATCQNCQVQTVTCLLDALLMMEQGHRQSLVKSAKGANVKLFDDSMMQVGQAMEMGEKAWWILVVCETCDACDTPRQAEPLQTEPGKMGQTSLDYLRNLSTEELQAVAVWDCINSIDHGSVFQHFQHLQYIQLYRSYTF